MRRFAFYILIGLIGFGAGVGLVRCLVTQPLEVTSPVSDQPNGIKADSIKADGIKDRFTEEAAFLGNPASSTGEEELSDEEQDREFEKLQMECYRPLVKRWLAGKRIVYGEREDGSPGFCAANEIHSIPYSMDFNGDGRKELAIRSGCAAVGNCQFFVFQKTGRGNYRLILKTDMVQQFYLRKSRSKGFYDLETRAHGSANSGDLIVFRFNGDKYKPVKCAEYKYPLDSKSDKPVITPRDCSEIGYFME